MFYFSPTGRCLTQAQHAALLAGDLAEIRPDLLAMNNRQLCDLAWRAGLPYPAPLAFARGTMVLSPHEGRRLWAAFMNPDYCYHGYDQNGRPLHQDDCFDE